MKWTIGLVMVALAGGFVTGYQSGKNTLGVPVTEVASMVASREVEVLQLRQQIQRLALEANTVVSNRDAEILRLMTRSTNK